MRPRGFLYCTGVRTVTGSLLAPEDAVRLGLVRPGEIPRGFSLRPGCIPIGANLFVDGGRQYAVYALAFRSPAQSFTLQKFGVGTGTRPPSVTDVALVNPVAFADSSYTKNVSSVSFPAPFVMRVEFRLGADDCNGYLLTELGLFSGDGTMLNRVVRPGINKTSDFAFDLAHEFRF